MPNRRRGDAAVTIAGERYTLRLTLGALAEMEDAFGAADLTALGERFAAGRLSDRDLVTLLAIALRGAGIRSPTPRWRRCRSTAAWSRSRPRSQSASASPSGAPPQNLRGRRAPVWAGALPLGG